mmetsp:Transcript_88207/g.139415  ORF Transcript_88207/g.139415 Transcript_88207/m.139415 type:complete len:211 (-) Transcript_88207:97-729(-)
MASEQSAKRRGIVNLEGGRPYFLSTWSRAAFDATRFPQSLNLSGGKAHLNNFDAPGGNLMSFRFISGNTQTSVQNPSQGSRVFTLACINAGNPGDSPIYLAPDLSVVYDESRAQLWEPLPYPALRRTVPGEVPLQIRAHGTDKLLCSDERRRTVCLLRPKEASVKDSATDIFVFNDAWEATPDVDPDDSDVTAMLQDLIGDIDDLPVELG